MNHHWAYCLMSATLKPNSVQKKVTYQISALNKMGLKTDGIFFTNDSLDNTGVNTEDVQFISNGAQPKGWFLSLKSKKQNYLSLEKWLEENHHKYDLIYVRYMLSSRHFYRIAKKYGSKMAIEFQTRDISELKSFYAMNPFGLRPSRFLSWLEHQLIPVLNERIWAPRVIGKIKYLIGVTKEIAAYQTNRAIGRRPQMIYMGNGINVQGISKRKTPVFEGNNLNLLMIIGSTPGSSWHGIDRILESIAKYKGDVGINLWICGNAEQSEFRNFPFVHFLGYKTGIELDELFDIAHIAIGGFAFDKIGLKEGSTLKLREYVARGIPVVYGHSDTDIDPLIEKGLVMKFTENQFPEMDKILNFAASFYKNPAHVDELHNFAVNNLDYTVKMKKLVEDIQSGDNKKD